MNKYSVMQVIPHREKMVLIDSLDNYDVDSATCLVKITAENLFYDNTKQGVPSYIGCEYMAQSIAAFSGAHDLDNGKPVGIGFLLGSRKYQSNQPYFSLNSVLKIIVNQLYSEESGLRVFDCTIHDQNNELLAFAKINVFQPDNATEFLKRSYE